MKAQTIKAIEKRLQDLGVVYTKRQSNYSDAQVLVVSDENQTNNEVFITEWNYDCELHQATFGPLIKWLNERDAYFECEYPGTFTLVLNY